MSSNKIVRAIDVGFGSTKFVALRQGAGEVHCGMFPSVAPQASATSDLGSEVFQRRNTCVVEVNGVRFEVGKDALLALDASYNRTLDTGFAATDAYIALVRGAIYYMGVDHIDLLMVGLPVNNVEKMQKELEKRLIGPHKIPNPRTPSGENGDRTVNVAQVKVLAQPAGAFFDYSVQNNRFQRMVNETNLIIDPGYFTLDWVVAKGTKVITARSDAVSGGMSAILATMAEAISKKIGTQLTDYTAIDDAIRAGKNPRFFGKEFDIKPYLPLGLEKARQSMSALATKVGSSADIDNIIVAGGGAEYFKKLVEAKFANHTVQITHDPVFANVRGFQFAGEHWLRQQVSRQAA